MSTSRLLYSLVLSGAVAGITACQMDTRPTPPDVANRAGSGNAAAGIETNAEPAAMPPLASSAAGTAGEDGMAGTPGAAGATPVGVDGGSQPDLPPTQPCEFCEPVTDTGGTDGGAAVDGNPLAGASMYVDPSLKPAQSGIAKIATNPVALWIGPWYGDPAGTVRRALEASGSQVRVLVAYNIYNRNCGGGSSGVVSNAEQYGAWIASLADAIGDHKVVVILEPDALPHDCDPSRTQALADAVTTLKSHPNAHVYIDAGNAGWVDADTMASRLIEAGIANADGFSLNVGDFETTAASMDYGMAISTAVGNKPFVIDTSRNGRGPVGSEWCNSPALGLGEQPTANTGNERVHAFLWIKSPGESDGECNGGPPAGDWFPSYAETLAANAVF